MSCCRESEDMHHRQGSQASSGDQSLPSTSDRSRQPGEATMRCSAFTAGSCFPPSAIRIIPQAGTLSESSKSQQQQQPPLQQKDPAQAKERSVELAKQPQQKSRLGPPSCRTASEQPQKPADASQRLAVSHKPVSDTTAARPQPHSAPVKSKETETEAVTGGLASLAQAASKKLAKQKHSEAGRASHISGFSPGSGKAAPSQPAGKPVEKPASTGVDQRAAASGLASLAQTVNDKQAGRRTAEPRLAEKKRHRHNIMEAQTQHQSSAGRPLAKQHEADPSQAKIQRLEALLQLCRGVL